MHLLSTIERYLRESGTPPTRFGREALADPGFVASLRRGREPREATVRRVTSYLARIHDEARSGR